MKTVKNASYDLDEYKILVELYKFYLDIVLKTLVATSTVSGAIISYTLSQAEHKSDHTLKLSLFGVVLPIIICFATGTGFIQAIPMSRELTESLLKIKEKLGLELAPHTQNLTKTLIWAGYSMTLISIILSGFFVYLLIKC